MANFPQDDDKIAEKVVQKQLERKLERSNPDKHLKYEGLKLLEEASMAIFLIAGITIAAYTHDDIWGKGIIIWTIMRIFVTGVLLASIAQLLFIELVSRFFGESSENILDDFEDNQYSKNLEKYNKEIEQYNTVIEMNKKIKDIHAMREIGQNIIMNNTAPVIINSDVKNSFSTISNSSINESNSNIKEMLEILAGVIETSKDKDAAKYFDRFHKELAKPDSDKTIIKSLWKSILSAVPIVGEIKEVVDVIKNIIGDG